MCHMSHATRVLPLASCHAVAHTGTMTYQHMHQTEGTGTQHLGCDHCGRTTYWCHCDTHPAAPTPEAQAGAVAFLASIGLAPDGGRTTTVDFPTLCDNGCGSATDDPDGQAWHDETCPSCHAMILDAGGMIHRMGY